MSDHSQCEHANFPPCALNDEFPHPDGVGNHGPAIGVEPLVNMQTGEARAVWICGFCNKAMEIADEISPMIGAHVRAQLAPFSNTWEEVEAATLEALGAHPGDAALNGLLGGIHEAQRLIAERNKPSEPERDETFLPMPVNEFAALFARTNTDTPEREN